MGKLKKHIAWGIGLAATSPQLADLFIICNLAFLVALPFGILGLSACNDYIHKEEREAREKKIQEEMEEWRKERAIWSEYYEERDARHQAKVEEALKEIELRKKGLIK
jgi:hypothetical protein